MASARAEQRFWEAFSGMRTAVEVHAEGTKGRCGRGRERAETGEDLVVGETETVWRTR